MGLEQIRVGVDNFCYVVYDEQEHIAAVIDPSFDLTPTLLFLESFNLDVRYIIATHYHHDHTSEIETLKKHFPKAALIASVDDGKLLPGSVDIFVGDDEHLKVGTIELQFFITPGHTQGSICILVDQKFLLTGDTLFIGNCGRTDLPGGSLKQMFDSLQRIKKLSDTIIVYPGHDYGDKPFDTLKNQKKTNVTLRAKNIVEFSKIP
ncbi:MAG: hydroxyacylglutathione hydrolase family protein [Candidatus Thermoplasmatota archaeon]